MLEIGAIVDAKVENIEHYGAWLKHDGDRILVQITQLAWVPPRHPSTVLMVGETVAVKILRFNPRDKVYAASLRALRRDLNPYVPLASLPARTRLPAMLWIRYMDGGASVVLPTGALGHLLQLDAPSGLRPGDALEVIIEDLDVDEGQLTLRAVGQVP